MKKINIVNSRVKKIANGDLFLNEKDFHPCTPFFITHKLKPSEFDYVFCKGVFEVTEYCREVIKRIDDLLKVDGLLEIQYFVKDDIYVNNEVFRPLSFFMHEFSLSTGDRYVLEKKEFKEEECNLIYKKCRNRGSENDNIESWSFGIVSDGKKNDRILKIIEQVENFKIKNYEIIICGPSPFINSSHNDYVKVLTDDEFYRDIRVPITKKKNKIIRNSKYENIVIMHDRISFTKNWYDEIRKHGNEFELLCPQILAEEDSSLRVQDWLEFKGNFADMESVGRLLPYNRWSTSVYIDGGIIIAKTRMLKENLYNENLHWGEAEDVDLCKRIYLSGALINLNINCKVLSETNRHPGNRIIKSNGKFERLKYCLVFLRNLVFTKNYSEHKLLMNKFKTFLNKD